MFGFLDNIYFKYQLSSVLVPLLIILYLFFTKLRPYLMYSLIYVAIIGTIDTYLLKDKVINAGKKYGHIHYYLYLLFHLVLLLPLLEFKKYGYPNVTSFCLFVISILIISFLPYWPYYLSREVFIYILVGTYIVFNFAYYLLAVR